MGINSAGRIFLDLDKRTESVEGCWRIGGKYWEPSEVKRNPKIKWEGRSVGKGRRRGVQVLGRTATLEMDLPSVNNYTIRWFGLVLETHWQEHTVFGMLKPPYSAALKCSYMNSQELTSERYSVPLKKTDITRLKVHVWRLSMLSRPHIKIFNKKYVCEWLKSDILHSCPFGLCKAGHENEPVHWCSLQKSVQILN